MTGTTTTSRAKVSRKSSYHHALERAGVPLAYLEVCTIGPCHLRLICQAPCLLRPADGYSHIHTRHSCCTAQTSKALGTQKTRSGRTRHGANCRPPRWRAMSGPSGRNGQRGAAIARKDSHSNSRRMIMGRSCLQALTCLLRMGVNIG